MATMQAERQGPASARPGTPRRVRVQLRRVHPWSVLKFSVIFYFCLLLVMLVGVAILYVLLDAIGVIDPIEELLGSLGFGEQVTVGGQVQAVYEINFGYIMRTLFMIGLISSALWAAFTVFVAFLYNLIADLTGGIEITMMERR